VISLRHLCFGLVSLSATFGCGGLVDFGPEDLLDEPPKDAPSDLPKELTWTRQFGSPGQDKASSVAFTPQGAVLLAGWTALGTDVPGDKLGSTDAFVRRYSRTGEVEWDVRFGSADSDGVYAAVAADEDVVVAGYARGALPGAANLGEGDAFVSRLGPDGTIMWTTQFGSVGEDVAYALDEAVSGDFLVVGYVEASLPAHASLGAEDAFWARFDGAGRLLASAQFGTDKQDIAFSVCAHERGSFAVAGASNAGLGGAVHRGKEDAFVQVYREDGVLVWSEQFGGPSKDVATSIVCLSDGSVAVAGYYYEELDGVPGFGSYDGFFRKYDREGTLVLSRVIGSTDSDYVFALAVDRQERFYLAGSTEGLVAGEAKIGRSDSFILVLDGAGSQIQSWQFGSPEFGEARAIVASETGRFAAAGYSQGPLPGQLGSGAVDAYVTVLE
jgi:hypothetical protein